MTTPSFICISRLRDESQKHLDQMRGYPLNQFSHSAASLYTRNHSNKVLSCFFRNNECWNQTRGVLTAGEITNLVAGQYIPKTVRSKIGFHGDIPNACRSCMNEPSPVESAGTISFDDSTLDDNSGLQPDLHTSPSTTTSN